MAVAARSREIVGRLALAVVWLLCASRRAMSDEPSPDSPCTLSSKRNLRWRSYTSLPITLSPGEVYNKYQRIDFPEGHIALKAFEAEVVDTYGNPVPLTDVYLHHWLVERVFVGEKPHPKAIPSDGLFNGTVILAPNDGICQDGSLGQYFGLGSETRLTSHFIPDPYGIVVGDPSAPPEGFQERWVLNVHAIDTRSALDRKGCTECRCDLYGHVDVSKRVENYTGGLLCCGDGDKCALDPAKSSEAQSSVVTYFLRYTVYWLDLSEPQNVDVVPVRIYIVDATDTGERQANRSFGVGCLVEYDVPACTQSLSRREQCVHTLNAKLPPLPKGGSVVYAVAHQHAGGIGATLYGEERNEICTSEPFYGSGTAAGDEAGYIVGMSACYPPARSVLVRTGEKLHIQSRYSSFVGHTGVMGLFYLLVAD